MAKFIYKNITKEELDLANRTMDQWKEQDLDTGELASELMKNYRGVHNRGLDYQDAKKIIDIAQRERRTGRIITGSHGAYIPARVGKESREAEIRIWRHPGAPDLGSEGEDTPFTIAHEIGHLVTSGSNSDLSRELLSELAANYFAYLKTGDEEEYKRSLSVIRSEYWRPYWTAGILEGRFEAFQDIAEKMVKSKLRGGLK